MQFIITLIIILLLCFILNVNINYILLGATILIAILSVCFTLGFSYCLIRLLCSKKRNATFLRLDNAKLINRKTAYYLVEGEEYPCIFPSENILDNLLYNPDKTYHVYLDIKKKTVFDRYSILTCILGLLFCISLDVGLILLFT